MGDVPEQAEPPGVDGPDDTDDTHDADEAEQSFVDGLHVRGEVVPAGTEPLPPGVTHEYVDDGDGGPATVRRRRFAVGPEEGT